MGIVIRRALVSVWDKQGIVPFAKELANLGIEIVSTGNTAEVLLKNGIKVTRVKDITGFPELFGGRVKTLHPKIHGAILYRRDKQEDKKQAKEQGIEPIDLVVANLYPFEQVVGKMETSMQKAVENIDIGGPAMVRAAAKNHEHVAVVVDPDDYKPVLEEIREKGEISKEKRCSLALKAFARTSSYDAAICRFLSSCTKDDLYPKFLEMHFEIAYPLRYGENPSQKAAAYRILGRNSIFDSKIHAGSKAMSYNNFLDADSAFGLIREFKDEIATVILKHNNPCGGAEGRTLMESYMRAYLSDPRSAFGGVIACSKRLDSNTAKAIGTRYIEVVLAPGFDDDAMEILKQKKSRRILDVSNIWDMSVERSVNFRYITGGMLYQGRDPGIYDKKNIEIVSKRKPKEKELDDLYFATKFAKHIKSNAIAIAKNLQLVGVGAGQMSRVDSCTIAIEKAKRHGHDTEGTVASSDAFMPFRDALDVLADAGITCIAQPGGSIRDQEVIDAADEKGVSLIFTGTRHFKH